MARRPKAVVFDMIGTTFSLEPVRAALVDLGFPGHALEIWFARTLRDAFALAATESFAPFRALFEANLDELARSQSIAIGREQKEHVLGQFAALPAHPDAAEAFETLTAAGIPIFGLTNGAAASTEKLLGRANLAGFVRRAISVDDIGVFKPRREIYEHAARIAAVMPSELALVATHAWDIHGAKSAGLLAAFVARGQLFPGMMKSPDVIEATLADAAHAIARGV